MDHRKIMCIKSEVLQYLCEVLRGQIICYTCRSIVSVYRADPLLVLVMAASNEVLLTV